MVPALPRRSSGTDDEAQLVARAQGGDEEAFVRLYELLSPRVHTVALRVLDDRRDAEEATQDTFVAAWRNLSRFRGDSRASTWVHRICVNRCASILRRRRGAEAPLVLLAERPDPSPGPAARAEVRDELDQVQAALAQLSSTLRVALALRDVADLSYEEVAEVLGISLTAARSRIHRGRTALLDLRSAAAPPGSPGSPPTEVARGA